MDYCTCLVTLGGDSRLQVLRTANKAASYAEVIVLRTVHGGQETVRDLKVIDQRPVDPQQEKQRLLAIYGPVVEQLYPGLRPNLPESVEGDPYLTEGPKPKRGRPRKDAEQTDPTESSNPMD